MTTEEKLELAKGWYNNPSTTQKEKGLLEKLFPELKESEDERIRKAIIEQLKAREPAFFAGYPIPKILAWLEKQGDTQKMINHAYAKGLPDAQRALKKQMPKMTPKWLYRLEYKDSSCGLWYDGNGKWCFESGIGSIDCCKTKELPMEYDERYKQDGRDWFSSCSQKDDLMHWYSLEDAKKLLSNGFVFTRYLATEYHEYDQQTVFIKETALYREEINIFELFEQKSPEWSEEDDRIVNLILCICNDFIKSFKVSPASTNVVQKDINKIESWLNSIRSKNKCKPSETVPQIGENLREIYADLKKIKEVGL